MRTDLVERLHRISGVRALEQRELDELTTEELRSLARLIAADCGIYLQVEHKIPST